MQSQLALQRINNLKTNTTSNHIAYVIYTSGTTDKPKGIMVEHKSVIGFCFKNNYLLINSKTITLGYSSYVFDGSIFDIFSNAIKLQKLILIDKNSILNERKFERLLKQHSVNTIFITTALFAQYARLKQENIALEIVGVRGFCLEARK